MFNIDNLILKKIETLTALEPTTKEVFLRMISLEDPSLKFSSDELPVTDAIGAKIASFYNNTAGTFSASSSLLSVNLLGEQFGSGKTQASATTKFNVPITEELPVGANSTVTLTKLPVAGSLKVVQILINRNVVTTKFVYNTTAGAGKFTLASQVVTLPTDVTGGTALVTYEYESTTAIKIGKNTSDIPRIHTLIIEGVFCDPCNANITYDGTIYCSRAQLDPTSLEIALTPEGKHPFTYNLNKAYCDATADLCSIYVESNQELA